MSRLALAEQERRRLEVDIAAGAANGLGFLGPAVVALMGVPMPGAVKAFTLSVKVLELIFQMVDRIRSMFS